MNDSLFSILDKFESDFKLISRKEDSLIKHKLDLEEDLGKALNIEYKNINRSSLLYKLAEDLKVSIDSSIHSWDCELEHSRPMKALSDEYTNRIILLVYGKVNAGKKLIL